MRTENGIDFELLVTDEGMNKMEESFLANQKKPLSLLIEEAEKREKGDIPVTFDALEIEKHEVEFESESYNSSMDYVNIMPKEDIQTDNSQKEKIKKQQEKQHGRER